MPVPIADVRNFEDAVALSLKNRRDRICLEYVARAPESMRDFVLRQTEIFVGLFDYSVSRQNYREDALDSLGFNTLADLKTGLEELKDAWYPYIDIHIADSGYRLVVNYVAWPPDTVIPAVDLTTTAVSVRFNFGGQVIEDEIDANESFMASVAAAVRRGKNPVDVLAYLATEGDNLADRKSINWEMRMGVEEEVG